MIAGLAGNFRSFQASLLSGAMTLFMLYVFFGEAIGGSVHPTAPVLQIVRFSKYVPAIGVLLASLLVGALYTIGLEGIVDSLHRHALTTTAERKSKIIAWLSAHILPLSQSARERLMAEATIFYDTTCAPTSGAVIERCEFIRAVVKDTLWMDGKLVGTPLLKQYNAFRSEGELLVSTSLLLAPTIAALSSSLGLGSLTTTVATTATALISLKLLDYGLYYYRRATSLIAHHVADGAVLTPTMESLRRSNPRFRPASLTPSPALRTGDVQQDGGSWSRIDDILEEEEETQP